MRKSERPPTPTAEEQRLLFALNMIAGAFFRDGQGRDVDLPGSFYRKIARNAILRNAGGDNLTVALAEWGSKT